MVERLGEDHVTARQLAAGLCRVEATAVDPGNVDTNIVRADVGASGRTAAQIASAMEHRQVRVSASTPSQLRFVTHRHIDAGIVDEAVAVFREVWLAV